jgi:hypothetical protein
VQRHSDRLDPGAVAGHLGQVVGQQPAGPQRTVDPDTARVQVGHPDKLGLPGGRVVGRLTEVGPVRHRVGSAAEVALEHAAHRVGAASGDLGDLDHRVALGAQQHHLVANAGRGVAGALVAVFQFGLGGLVQPHAQRRSHDRPPCDQET